MATTCGLNATLLYGKMPYSHLNNNTCRCLFIVGDRSDVCSRIFGFSSTYEDQSKYSEALAFFIYIVHINGI